MAEITRRRQGEMVRKVFEVLVAHPDGLPAKDVLDRVAREMKLTEFEQSTYPANPSVRRLEKIVRFSTIAAVKAGWLAKSKGRWSLTVEGKRAFEKFSYPAEFFSESSRLYRAWASSQPEQSPEAV